MERADFNNFGAKFLGEYFYYITNYGLCKFSGTLLRLSFSFSNGATAASGPGPHYQGSTITRRYTTLGRTPLDE
jgi:hypothetical protein